MKVPDATRLGAVEALCAIEDPYAASAANDALFVLAMKQSIEWHRTHSPFYARLLSQRQFDPERLERLEDCATVPFVLAAFFKQHEVRSRPLEAISVHLTSSGTTGQKSQMFFDDWSLRSAQRMIDFIFQRYGWTTPDKAAEYLLYTYETERDSKLGTAFTDNYLCRYAPVRSAFYALRRTGTGGHEFDVFGCIDALQKAAERGSAVRIFGFPSFLYFTLKRMRDLKLPPLSLSPDSLVFLGGGWKGNAEVEISKQQLYEQVTAQLGIPDERLRDGFGSVEHCIPYIECVRHEFHVPVYSRVFIRDVETLAVLPPREPGFLHFVSPYITSVPAISVLMGDMASLHPPEDCACGLSTPFFRVHGRAGTSRNRSCAISAAELLKREA